MSEGTAYEKKPSTLDAKLTEVGRGTPMGELLRIRAAGIAPE